jgi:ATPase subunit of ABC transporter with duplicated ATPase domains
MDELEAWTLYDEARRTLDELGLGAEINTAVSSLSGTRV